MHFLLLVPALYASFTFAVHPAMAQPAPASTQEHAATIRGRDAGSPATRIEADDRAGVIRFFIGGRETMRLDANGLHVRDNIDYGGTVTDYGPGGFDAHKQERGG